MDIVQAIRLKDSMLVKSMVEAGIVNVNCLVGNHCNKLRSILAVATEVDSPEIVRILLDLGAETGVLYNNYGKQEDVKPLHFVKSLEVAVMLVIAGAEVDTGEGILPILFAAKPKIYSMFPEQCLHKSIDIPSEAVIKFLVNFGLSLETKDRYGKTLLMNLLYSCTGLNSPHPLLLATITLLLELGADPNNQEVSGVNSVSVLASKIVEGKESIYRDIFNVLLDYGANAMLPDNQGVTAFDKVNDTEIAKRILRQL